MSTATTENQTRTRSIRACDVAGHPDAPPIVLLHAAAYTRKAWLPQVRALADRFRVYAVDLPGHGERADQPFDYQASIRLLEAFLALHVRRPAVLVGISLGGCLSLDVAAHCPRRVTGLVLSGSSFDARGTVCKLILKGESIVFVAKEHALIRRYHRFLRRTQPSDIAEEIVAAGSYWHASAQAVLQLRGRDFFVSLRAYDGPILVLNGQRDIVHRSSERAFVRAAKNARLATIPGGNHVCNLDRAELFSETVAAFASEAFASAAASDPDKPESQER
jgi:pimeloyl-ACP methyl ester carboxylesterase